MAPFPWFSKKAHSARAPQPKDERVTIPTDAISFTPPVPPRVAELIDTLNNSTDLRGHKKAIEELGNLRHPAAIPTLTRYTLPIGRISDLRFEAVQALGKINHPDATRALIAQVEDTQSVVNLKAAEILVSYDKVEAIPAITKLGQQPGWHKWGINQLLKFRHPNAVAGIHTLATTLNARDAMDAFRTIQIDVRPDFLPTLVELAAMHQLSLRNVEARANRCRLQNPGHPALRAFELLVPHFQRSPDGALAEIPFVVRHAFAAATNPRELAKLRHVGYCRTFLNQLRAKPEAQRFK